MNTAELAGIVGVSTKTIRRWIRDYNIPCQKNEYGHFIFTDEDLTFYNQIRDQLKNGTPNDEIKAKVKQPRKGTVRTMQKGTDQPVEQLVAKLLERVEQNERRIESKASDVVSYQLLQHRNELDELQKKVKQLEDYIQVLENERRNMKRETTLKIEPPVQKPRRRKKIMGFLL
ncbi:MerR family transcriptional regulator [Ferdinandcohnia quinoae]|uniref:Chromosome-anchoring protein RacA n=1 Tax=Fredinandcohnia quinoae TaxID=2918902 RepID=A0AAW5E684_9BACI|nr:MerR family transcriptional regulator [Fredinandcohnia sp. SECRCQ15]